MTGVLRHAVAALAVASLCLLWLHAIHMLAGHERFSNYGLIPAAILVAVVNWCFLRRSLVTAVGSVLPLFTLVEWLEGELAAGHRISWPVLADHGWTLLLGAVLLLAGVMAVEAQRLIRLVRNL